MLIVSLICKFIFVRKLTSSRDGFVVVVYCLLLKAFEKSSQLTALSFKNILFYSNYNYLLTYDYYFFAFTYSFVSYLHGNVVSVISLLLLLIVLSVLFVKLLMKLILF